MSNVVNVNSPTANMYGCEPCPKCGAKYRYVSTENRFANAVIKCDDCGFKEEPKDGWEEGLR